MCLPCLCLVPQVDGNEIEWALAAAYVEAAELLRVHTSLRGRAPPQAPAAAKRADGEETEEGEEGKAEGEKKDGEGE